MHKILSQIFRPVYFFTSFLRKLKFIKQRIFRGFSDAETWSLDFTIAQFILPRLKRFKEINSGFPFSVTSKKWDCILDSMILAFQHIVNNENLFLSTSTTSQELKQIKKEITCGLKLFSEYFTELWW